MRGDTKFSKLANMCVMPAAQSGISDSEGHHGCSLHVSGCLRFTAAVAGGSGRQARLSREVAVDPVCGTICKLMLAVVDSQMWTMMALQQLHFVSDSHHARCDGSNQRITHLMMDDCKAAHEGYDAGCVCCAPTPALLAGRTQ